MLWQLCTPLKRVQVPRDFRVLQILGEGAHGVVRQARLTSTGRYVVVKQPKLDPSKGGDEVLRLFNHEAATQVSLEAGCALVTVLWIIQMRCLEYGISLKTDVVPFPFCRLCWASTQISLSASASQRMRLGKRHQPLSSSKRSGSCMASFRRIPTGSALMCALALPVICSGSLQSHLIRSAPCRQYFAPSVLFTDLVRIAR